MRDEANPAKVRASARRSSALAYGALATLSIVYFEYRSDLLDAIGLVLVPYLTFVCLSIQAAYLLGGWYVRQSGVGIFETVAVPLMVVLCSAAGAGALYGIAVFISAETSQYAAFVDTVAAGFATAIIFILLAWPVLLVGACAATAWLSWKYSGSPVADAV